MRKRSWLLILLCCVAASGSAAETTFSTSTLTIETDQQDLQFDVELALTPEQRSRGLMFRRDLPRDAGMLFDFNPPREVSMWMRNTPLPLDMLFIGPDGRITKIHANAVPYSDATISSGGKVRAVLELNAGTAAALGIEPGDRIRQRLLFP